MWGASRLVRGGASARLPRCGARVRIRSNPHRTARRRQSRPVSREPANRPGRAPRRDRRRARTACGRAARPTRSASSPGASAPRSSRPSARAPSSVAICRAAAVESASGSPHVARASSSAARSSSNRSSDSADDGLSVPRPTRMPAARRRASGATPQPSRAFERGQCATAAPVAARAAMSSSSDVHRVRDDGLGAEETRARRARGSGGGRRARPSGRARRCPRPSRRARGATRRGA